MIVAFLRRPELQSVVRSAALPEEDVFSEGDRARDALLRGFPRLLIVDDAGAASRPSFRSTAPAVPVLRLVRPGDLFGARDAGSLAVADLDDARALRRLMHETAGDGMWVDQLFRDLVMVSGQLWLSDTSDTNATVGVPQLSASSVTTFTSGAGTSARQEAVKEAGLDAVGRISS